MSSVEPNGKRVRTKLNQSDFFICEVKKKGGGGELHFYVIIKSFKEIYIILYVKKKYFISSFL